MRRALARMFHQICISDVERIGIIDEEVAVHVEAGCDTGSGGLRPQETMPGVGGDAACVYDPDGVEHGASIFIQNYIVADRIAVHLQIYALGFERSCIWTVVIALNRRAINEIG